MQQFEQKVNGRLLFLQPEKKELKEQANFGRENRKDNVIKFLYK